MSSVYGYVNGQVVESRDEFIYKARGFNEITSDDELIKFAEKVTGHWYNAGHRRTFISYYLSDYALDEPKKSLTDKEYKRLIELQKIAIAEYKPISNSLKAITFKVITITSNITIIVLVDNLVLKLFITTLTKSLPPVDPFDLKIIAVPIPIKTPP